MDRESPKSVLVEGNISQNPSQSFWKKWGLLIGFGFVVLAFLAAFKVWRDAQEQAPIDTSYQTYLDALAVRSHQAQAYLQRYFEYRGRQTIASRDFVHVCAQVTALAERQGVDADQVSADIASGCRRKLLGGRLGQLPS